ncbi:MAG: glycosyltransferase family 4 protein [Thermoguttaceae bacterium]
MRNREREFGGAIAASSVFVSGYPSDVGGANTELWHTVRLWRRFGVEVVLIPTWRADPVWRGRLEAIGCRTVESNPDDLQNVPGLAGAAVVSFCNTRFLAAAERFRSLGCKIVWLNCMNWLFPEERLHYRRFGVFDRYVFQSLYQRGRLAGELAKYGYRASQGVVIRGALDPAAFPFRPRRRAPGETFVVGRLSRPAPEKFSPHTWAIFGRMPSPRAARVMGWSDAVQARLGGPPPWAECLPAGAESSRRFLEKLHCLVQLGGSAVENWPRVGLEAMAAGVPLVVDRKGGWKEMIRHGQTGFLCETDATAVECVARLARDEPYRQAVVTQARRALENELADPQSLWNRWRCLLMGLGEAATGQRFLRCL